MSNPINDFSRLRDELPPRHSERDLRQARRTTLKFFEESQIDGFEWPVIAQVKTEVKFYLSYLIDQATLKVYNEAVRLIQKTPEHLANFKALRTAPKNCGGFKKKKAILDHANAFEQMVTLDHVIAIQKATWPVGRRTYCFHHDDTNVIPLYVSSRRACKASIMTTILGAAKGPYKVPTYQELASSEDMAESSIFVKPLESLEIVRQPYFSGATTLKANAFASCIIDYSHRYRVEIADGTPSQYACVEHKKQNSPQQAPLKERSAGSNMLFLEKTARSKKLAKTLHFEEWGKGYKEADTSIQVNDYWDVLTKTARSENDDKLVDLTRNLFVSRTGPFTSPNVNNFYAKKLFQVEK